MSTDSIRVVVCGDEGVGKSSLITSLVKEAFVPNIQKVLPPITIPKDYSSPFAPTNTILIDTSSSPQDLNILQREIRHADVIWLVYADQYSCERISLYWMEMFRSMGVNLPVVLCANKSDLIPPEEGKRVLSEEMIPILKEYKEIESCIRASAKNHYNVNEAFYLCQRAITHPISPLFDSKEGNLKPLAVAALRRIFSLCDKDQDGFLSDSELSELQQKCFKKNLDKNEISQIKRAVKKELNLDDETMAKGLSVDGFILLNKLFAEKGRHETTWGILRTFHYTDSLSLNDKFLHPKLEVPPQASVELSPVGNRFFVDLFLLFDKDNDGRLNENELNALFQHTPGIPKLWQDSDFPRTTVSNEQGFITLQGWLAQWSMTTFLEYKTTLAYLAYLGFESQVKGKTTTAALKVTKPRRKKQIGGKVYRTDVLDRTVFNCFVLGAPGSGKSLLLDAFINRPHSELHTPTIHSRMVVNSVELREGKQCYIILEELGEMEPAILENRQRLETCDVICYMFDSSDPDSFAYLVDLRAKYPYLDELPCIYVASKADLDRQQQRSDVQPDVYTRQLHLQGPLHVSVRWGSSLNELFVQLAEAAQRPRSCTPGLDPEPENQVVVPPIYIAGGTAALISLVTLWIWRSSHAHS